MTRSSPTHLCKSTGQRLSRRVAGRAASVAVTAGACGSRQSEVLAWPRPCGRRHSVTATFRLVALGSRRLVEVLRGSPAPLRPGGIPHPPRPACEGSKGLTPPVRRQSSASPTPGSSNPRTLASALVGTLLPRPIRVFEGRYRRGDGRGVCGVHTKRRADLAAVSTKPNVNSNGYLAPTHKAARFRPASRDRA